MSGPARAAAAPQMNFPPVFATVEAERQRRQERLAGALRIFGRFGFGEGVAGHIIARRS